MPLRLALVMLLLALAGCAPVASTPPPAVTDATTTTDGAYVCVTTSYDLTECTLAEDVQPGSPAP